MSTNFPLRGGQLLGVVVLAASCANVIGLDGYERSDETAGSGAGRSGGRGGGSSAAAGEGGLGGEPTRGEGGAAGSELGAKPGGEAGEGVAPEPSGGQRATGGQRGLGGESGSGGTLSPGNGGAEPAEGGDAGAGATGGDGTTPGPTPTSCSLPGFPTECTRCIDQSCDALCEPCLDDAECAALTACLRACPSDTCLDDCLESSPDAAPAFLEVYASCAFTTCQASCGAPFGSPCDEGSECTTGYCSGPGGFCSSPCADDLDCPTTAWCAPDSDGIDKCLLRCETEPCPAGHGCGYVSTWDDYAYPLCTTALPLSAPCDFDFECHSGLCTGEAGWCTNYCLDDFSCAPDASCVIDGSGEPRCLVDCVDDDDCAAHPQSYCSTELAYDELDPELDELVDVCFL